MDIVGGYGSDEAEKEVAAENAPAQQDEPAVVEKAAATGAGGYAGVKPISTMVIRAAPDVQVSPIALQAPTVACESSPTLPALLTLPGLLPLSGRARQQPLACAFLSSCDLRRCWLTGRGAKWRW